MTRKNMSFWRSFNSWQKGSVILLIVVALLFLRWNYVKQARNSCNARAESEAHQAYLSSLVVEDSITKAMENGTYLIPAYNHAYQKCLELKGL